MKTATPNIKTFYKGQIIFKEGQESNVAYMVRKGTVSVSKMVNNRRLTIDRLGEGEIFGEMGIVTESPRTHDAEAETYCELMVLTRQMLDSLLTSAPKTVQLLARSLSRRLARTTAMVQDRDHQSAFLSVCQLLDMLNAVHQATPAAERKKNPDFDLGLNFAATVKRIKAVVMVSQLEIENVLGKLASLKVIDITAMKQRGAAMGEKFIRLRDPEHFLEVATSLHKQLEKSEFSLRTDAEYLDLVDFAAEIGVDTRDIYRKLAQNEIPESLFFLHRSRALAWAEKLPADYFTRQRKKRIDELSEIDDIVHVDNATLKQVFERLGYYKLGILAAVAGEDARAKIFRNLSRKIAEVVQSEASGRERVDPAEAEDIREELLDVIREIKQRPA